MILIRNSIELNSPKRILFNNKKDSNQNLHFNSSKKMIKMIEISLNQEKPSCPKTVQGKRIFVKEDSFIA
jgi:hypothetical protein